MVSARITVPAPIRNARTRCHTLNSSTRGAGSRYGGNSRTSGAPGPFSTVRLNTAAAVSAATTDNMYIANSRTAPALK